MRFVFAFILFFYMAFDGCFAETMAHQADVEIISVDANELNENCDDTADSESTESHHDNVCHTCNNCHNWLENFAGFLIPNLSSDLNDQYSFVLPLPETQKIERPPIFS